MVDAQEWGQLTDEAIHLNETIHQSTRLRIMTLLVSLPEEDRFAYGFIQQTLDLTGGNLTTHLRKLEDADYLVITKEFVDSKPRTWVQATSAGTPCVRRIPIQPAQGAQLAAAHIDARYGLPGVPKSSTTCAPAASQHTAHRRWPGHA